MLNMVRLMRKRKAAKRAQAVKKQQGAYNWGGMYVHVHVLCMSDVSICVCTIFSTYGGCLSGTPVTTGQSVTVISGLLTGQLCTRMYDTCCAKVHMLSTCYCSLRIMQVCTLCSQAAARAAKRTKPSHKQKIIRVTIIKLQQQQLQ